MREDFSGYLICSDYDGTFAHNGTVPKRNIEAVKEYISRGGLFTFCTGRNYSAASQGYPILPNAPMVSLSGGQIGDVISGKMLEGYPMCDELFEDMRKIAEKYPVKNVEICFDLHSLTDISGNLPEKPSEPVYKAILFTETETVSERENIFELCGGRYEVSFNGPSSVELTCGRHNKGTGALRVKELTGAKIIVGIGDYDADLPLLSSCDIAAAPKGSRIEKRATVVTACAADGALADLIERM